MECQKKKKRTRKRNWVANHEGSRILQTKDRPFEKPGKGGGVRTKWTTGTKNPLPRGEAPVSLVLQGLVKGSGHGEIYGSPLDAFAKAAGLVWWGVGLCSVFFGFVFVSFLGDGFVCFLSFLWVGNRLGGRETQGLGLIRTFA